MTVLKTSITTSDNSKKGALLARFAQRLGDSKEIQLSERMYEQETNSVIITAILRSVEKISIWDAIFREQHTPKN